MPDPTTIQIRPAVCLHLHHVLSLSHKAFTYRLQKISTRHNHCPTTSQAAPPPLPGEQKTAKRLRVTQNDLYDDPRSAHCINPTDDVHIPGGTAVMFAMLLGFVNPSRALQVSPSALTFSATSGGTDPSPQTVVLSSNRSRERTWASTVNATWVTIMSPSGTIATENDTISVRTTAAGLAAGSYSASVTITSPVSAGGSEKRSSR
jgi:hypothetical protein